MTTRTYYVAMFLLALYSRQATSEWSNTLGGMLLRSCMYGFGISGVYSEFDPTTEDRLWKLDCARMGFRDNDTCWWTKTFINDWVEDIEFECGKNEYVSGLYSDFDLANGDRHWRIECCSSLGLRFSVCLWTDWQNDPRQDLEFKLPRNKALHGLFSEYDLENGDRKWKFRICEIEK